MQGTYRLGEERGDFEKVSPELAVSYEFLENKLRLRFLSNLPVKRRRDGQLAAITPEVGSIFANPGDIYYQGEWEFQLSDYVERVQSI
jgi:hypothetical protein